MFVDETTLTVENSDALVENWLTIVERKMLKNGWGEADMQEIPIKAYEVIREEKEDRDNPGYLLHKRAIKTYQGFHHDLKKYLEEQGCHVLLTDLRSFRPEPQLNLMHGFRFSQERLLSSALICRKSGLIGAPTRYGKTYLIINTLRAYKGYKCVVVCPGLDLVEQLYEDIKGALKDRHVVWMKGNRNQSKDITVVSMDSLHKIDKFGTEILLIDEPHATVTDDRLFEFSQFTKALRLGFGATLKGRFDRRDKIILGIVGPVLSQITYKEARDEGAVAHLKAVFLRIPFSYRDSPVRTYEAMMNRLLCQNKYLANTINRLSEEVIPQAWQTLMFIKNEKQADMLADTMEGDIPIAMAKKLTRKERKRMSDLLKDGSTKRTICSNIYIQGVTFSLLRCLVNLSSGGANTGAIQKPGRLLEVRKGKNYGVMFDLMFECVDADQHFTIDRKSKVYNRIIGESQARCKLYEEVGYEVIHANGVDDPKLKEIIEGAYDSTFS